MKQYFIRSCIILSFLFISPLIFAQSAGIKGKILNNSSGEGLAGAFVALKNTSYKTTSGSDGSFELNNLSAGNYDVVVEYVGFVSLLKKIEIKPGKTTVVSLGLHAQSEELQKVTVYGRLDRGSEASSRISEKNANNITNVISGRAMERSPDINAANALQRVSAVTIQRNSGSDEAYAIIRGLEPRYNNTLINGVKVTSPDPSSRFVSLSIVPSDLLERIEVSKSLLPEMEGDAIGGTVNLIMKDAPDTAVFKALGSIGYSNIFFNRKYDNFFKSDIQQKSVYQRFGAGYTANPADFSRSNLNFQQKTALPTSLLSFTYGKRFFKNKLGIILSDSYQNQYYGSNSQFNIVGPDNTNNFKPGITDVANRTYSTQQLNNGLSLHVDYNINDKNKIIVNNVFLYSYLAQSRLSIDTSITGGNGGRIGPGTGSVFNDNRSFTQKQNVENLKVEGQHILSKHFYFNWAGVYSDATSKSPDRADISVDHKINADFTSTPFFFDNISRIWQNNNDKDLSGSGSLSYKSALGTKSSIELKAGGLYRHSTRYNQQDQYTLKPVANTNGVKQVFTDINSAQWIVYNAAGTFNYDAANYTAYEDITAGYGEAKLSLNKLDIFGGVRIEDTKQGYDTKTVVLTTFSNAKKTYRDVLPSLQLKYKLNNKTNLRASYFKSIARPSLFELVPAATRGQETDVTGNPFLKHTESDNFDIRYEFFPRNEEQFFISGFYKNLVNPIEFALISFDPQLGSNPLSQVGANALAGGQLHTTPVNFGNAKVAGAELVYSRYFGNFGISGNYTYIYSNIKSAKIVPDAQSADGKTVFKSQSRPLQGQTGNVVNLSLLYKNDIRKIFVQLAYEYSGKTLSQVYPNYGYDYYQQPQSFLALSAEKQLNNHFTLTAKLNNILNTPATLKINDIIVGKDIYKANFNIGLRYSH